MSTLMRRRIPHRHAECSNRKILFVESIRGVIAECFRDTLTPKHSTVPRSHTVHQGELGMARITGHRALDHDRAGMALSKACHSVAAIIQRSFIAERARWALCIPVFLGIGIASYFHLSEEPALWWGSSAALIALGAAIVLRRHHLFLILCVIGFLVATGFGAAQFRTVFADAPVLDRKIGPVWITGDVSRVESRPRGIRLWLNNPVIDRLTKQSTPLKIRVKIAMAAPELRAGNRVKLLAVLHPPSGPAAPGAFDFARKSYFAQLGAVGYVVRVPEIIRSNAATEFVVRLAALRQTITERIRAALPGQTGSVAAVLMTGERSQGV